MNGEYETPAPAEPSAPAEASLGLLTRVREHLSLSRVQAIFGILAALTSIGGPSTATCVRRGRWRPIPARSSPRCVTRNPASRSLTPRWSC
jgi:hypothetical protein